MLTRRMLSVSSPLEVALLRAGIRRAYGRRSNDRVPPEDVLAAFYAADPEFELDERGHVRAVTQLDWQAELGKSDRVFVAALRSAPARMLDRASFHDACAARGMTSAVFGAATRTSVVLDNPFTDVWSLRGTRVSTSAAAALRAAKASQPRTPRVQAYGRRGGVSWLSVSVPRSRGVSLVVRVPTPLADSVAGLRFRAQTVAGSDVGTVVVNDAGSSWGYQHCLSQHGAGEDDVLVVELDPRELRAVLTLEAR
jgi:hypothetical protein